MSGVFIVRSFHVEMVMWLLLAVIVYSFANVLCMFCKCFVYVLQMFCVCFANVLCNVLFW